MKVKDSRDDLSQCGCDTCVMKDKTSNGVQACSDLAHVVLVLVGVRHVTIVIVHIGYEGVLVVKHFCVAILFVICCIRRCSLYRFEANDIAFERNTPSTASGLELMDGGGRHSPRLQRQQKIAVF